MITLHFNNTTLDIQEEDDSYRYRSLMGEHNLTLKFSLNEYVEIPIGAWCEFMAIKYTLEAPANIKKNGTRDIEYTLIMESAQNQLGRYKLRNTVDKRLKFSMCATPNEFLKTIVDNLNMRDNGWSVGECIVSTEKTIPFDHSFIDEALQSLADTFETEWEIVGKVIHLHKVEYFKDDPLPLSYGKGNGFVPGVGRSTEADSRPVEILFVQGGNQNIDRSKYGSAELLLPKSQILEYEGRTYISDADGYSIRRQDKAIKYNNEDSLDCSEIYPSRIGTVSKVTVVDAAKNFYDIIDNSIPANLNYNEYLIEGESMTVIFQSGMLAGNDKAFECKYNHSERKFELVPQEIDGLTMPGDVYIPRVGDTYAVFGCMLPDAYICDNATKTGASWDMFKEAARHMFENEDVKFTFTGELQGLWAKRNWLRIGGRMVVGSYIMFSDEQFAPDGISIRITGIKEYLTSPYSPTIELSNSVSGKSVSSTLKEIQNNDVIVEDNQKKIIQYTKRRFRDSLETIQMLEQAMIDNFTNSISPIAVQTMAMLVGDESLQFRFVNSSLNPIEYNIEYNQTTKQLTAPATILQHMTIGINTITSNRDKNSYKRWTMTRYVSPVLSDGSSKYYLYAKVPVSGKDSGTFILDEKSIKMTDVSGYYLLLVGILNTEYDGERSFAPLYGFTEVLPGQVRTDKIMSADGNSWIDLLSGAMQLGEKLKYVDNKLILDFLFADGANIGGWIFKNGRLESQTHDNNNNPMTYLNGVNGEMRLRGTMQLSTGYSGNISDKNLFYLPAITEEKYLSMGHEIEDIGKVCRLYNSSPLGGARYLVYVCAFGINESDGIKFTDSTIGSNMGMNYYAIINPQSTVELTCFELPKTFNGKTYNYVARWDITSRFDTDNFKLSQATGRFPRSIAIGTITISSNSSYISGKFHDGRELSSVFSVTRTGEGNGNIRCKSGINLPNSYYVFCTGSYSAPRYGTVRNLTKSGFDLTMSDDDSANDGTVEFMILDYNWWYDID